MRCDIIVCEENLKYSMDAIAARSGSGHFGCGERVDLESKDEP